MGAIQAQFNGDGEKLPCLASSDGPCVQATYTMIYVLLVEWQGNKHRGSTAVVSSVTGKWENGITTVMGYSNVVIPRSGDTDYGNTAVG